MRWKTSSEDGDAGPLLGSTRQGIIPTSDSLFTPSHIPIDTPYPPFIHPQHPPTSCTSGSAWCSPGSPEIMKLLHFRRLLGLPLVIRNSLWISSDANRCLFFILHLHLSCSPSRQVIFARRNTQPERHHHHHHHHLLFRELGWRGWQKKLEPSLGRRWWLGITRPGRQCFCRWLLQRVTLWPYLLEPTYSINSTDEFHFL